jgi:Xaa-Pro aminopeptidase
MDRIARAQQELQRRHLSGWLIYDFRGSNPFAKDFLEAKGAILSRRWFLFIPAEDKPTLLLHAIEQGSLPTLPYTVRAYSSRQSLTTALAEMLPQAEVALEYSPMNDIPYVSCVDAGTVELLRSLGVTPVSSADLLQLFSAWTPEQLKAHLTAVMHVETARELGLETITQEISAGKSVSEIAVQKVMTDYFRMQGVEFDHPPIVGFGPHAGDPHYTPRPQTERTLQPGDAILLDIFAKLPGEAAPYADITWMGCYGEPSEQLQQVFEVVREARDLAVTTIAEAYKQGRAPQGREIDRATRDFITGKGYGEAFTHRTGHSIGTRATHGEAVHLDDFETCDTRQLLPGIAVTVEPGIYLPEFGVRSEINLILEESGPRVTTEVQQELTIVKVEG